MEKGNEEVSEKAVSKDMSIAAYEEIRIEVFLSSLVSIAANRAGFDIKDFRLNNIIIPGFKDIGTEGQAVFILRKIGNNDKKL